MRSGPQFFAFYSFKGGVGRSMALINTAAHLARRGRRILAIDLDLEAPGISYLSAGSESNVATDGFVDAIHELLQTPHKSRLISSSATEAIAAFTKTIDLTALAQSDTAGTIEILPAGRLSDVTEYQRRLRAIDFANLYREGVGVRVLEHFKSVIIKSQKFDYVLVDSRTGLSTEAGIAVRDLADHLVVVMGLNHQNVTGTADFLRLIRAGQPQPKTLTVVLSPIPLGEDDLAEQRIRIAEKALAAAWPNEFRTPLTQLQIPYHPRLAFQEQPHIARLTTRPLTQAYAQLERQVRELAGDTPDAFTQQARHLIKEGQWDEAIEPLHELLRFKSPGVRFMAAEVLRNHVGDRDFDAYAKILTRFATNDSDAALLAGEHFAKSNRIGRAERIIRSRLAIKPDDTDAWIDLIEWWERRRNGLARAKAISLESLEKNPSSAVLHNHYALFLNYNCHDPVSAEPYYRRALELDPSNYIYLSNYGLFLWNARGEIEEAKQLFLQALEIEPLDSNTNSNYSEVLMADRDFETARHHLEEAWLMRDEDHKFVTAETLFRAGLWHAVQGQSDDHCLQQLAGIVRGGFEGEFVDLNRIVDMFKTELGEQEQVYKSLAGVLSRRLHPRALKKLRRWRKFIPLELEEELFA